MDDVQWSSLEHNFGVADDVPGILTRCADRDAVVARAALGELDEVLFHQGGWVCPAAAAALPFLLDLVENQDVHERPALLSLVRSWAEVAQEVDSRFVDPEWQPAVTRATSRLLALLADPVPEVRRVACAVVATACPEPADAAEALLERWRVEHDRVTRLDVAIALGKVLAARPDLRSVHALLERLLTDDDPQLRMAAVLALAETDPQLPQEQVPTLVDAVRDKDADIWLTSIWGAGTRQTLVHRAGGLLHDAPSALRAFAAEVLQDADADHNVAAVGQLGWVLARWRNPEPDLVDLVAGQLTSPFPEVRYRAVHLLGCMGEQASTYADGVAALLHDSSPRQSRLAVAVSDASLWALARFEDRRCVEEVERVLTDPGARLQLDAVHTGRDTWGFTFMQPSIQETLALLTSPPVQIVGAVIDRLPRLLPSPDVAEVRALCVALAHWGPLAAEAAPVLERFLDRPGDVATSSARALAAIGPRAASSATALQRLARPDAKDSATFAWAHWRVSGDPTFAVDALSGRHDVRPSLDVLRYMAEFGPSMRSGAGFLRTLLMRSTTGSGSKPLTPSGA